MTDSVITVTSFSKGDIQDHMELPPSTSYRETRSRLLLESKMKKEDFPPRTYAYMHWWKLIYCNKESKSMRIEYVSSYNHRANKAERTIRDFKNDFIETLGKMHSSIPLALWDGITLSLHYYV